MTLYTLKPMNFECVEKRYAVEVDMNLFSILDGGEYSGSKPTLFDELDKMPELWKVDYNGHFSNYVYFIIAAEHDNPSLHKKIQRCIEKHLRWCEKYRQKHSL